MNVELNGPPTGVENAVLKIREMIDPEDLYCNHSMFPNLLLRVPSPAPYNCDDARISVLTGDVIVVSVVDDNHTPFT